VERGRAHGALRGGDGGQLHSQGGRPGKRLKGDDRLYEELDYCVPRGIPHSVFLEWDEDDQDKALAYQRLKARSCPSCGTLPEDWEEDEDAYVGWHDNCSGCAALERERENNVNDNEKGVRFFLLPRREAERRMEELGFAEEAGE
jgi:hypothetical protein